MDYLKKTVVPIRDTWEDDAPVVFLMDFYGVEASQLCAIPFVSGKRKDDQEYLRHVGSAPIIRALRRRGFDPDRYRAWLWDIKGEEWTPHV